MAFRKTWAVQPGSIVKTATLGIGASQIASKFVPLAQELTVENAYIKISNIHGNKNNLTIKYAVLSGADEISSGYESFTPTLDGTNFIAQAYNYLKTLPEFAGAQDC
jgi:hypothetical protein